MSVGPWVDKAVVGVVPDLSHFTRELNAGISRALAGVQREADRITKQLERSFEDSSRTINRSLGEIGGPGQFAGVRTEAERAADHIEGTFQAASREADQALDEIGGPGVFTGVEAQAGRAADQVGVEFREAGQVADRALDQIGGVGQFTGIRTQAETTANHVEGSFQEASREADRALDRIGGPGQFVGLQTQARIAAARISGSFASAATATKVALSGIATAAVGFGAAFVSILGVAGVAAAGMGLKTAASMEQAQISFEELLGSGQKAKTFLADLNRFAAATPFEFPGLVAASRQLLGAGQAAKDIIPTLTAVGNATGALGLEQEQFERIMLAVTQAMNKGKLQGEELMQIQEAGLPVTKLLAEAMGVTTKRVGELSQAGKLQSDVVLPKLFAQMQKDYGGAMVRQSQTLNGLWSTFTDTVRTALADAVQPLIPALKTALPRAAEAFKDGLKGAVDFIRDELAPRLSDLWHTLRDDLIPRVRETARFIHDHLVVELQDLKRGWDDNKDAIKALTGQLFDFNQKSGTGARLIHGFVEEVQGAITIVGWFARLLNLASGALNAVNHASQTAGAAVHHWIGDMFTATLRGVRSWASAFKAAFRESLTAVEDRVQGWADTLRVKFRTGLTATEDRVQSWANTIRAKFRSGLTSVEDRVQGWANSIRAMFRTGLTAVEDRVQGWATSVRAFFRNAMQQVEDTVRARISAVVGWFRGLPGRVRSAVGNLGRVLLAAGRSLVSGLLQGARDSFAGIAGMVRDLKNRIVGGLKAVFGIRSPSSVMAGIGSQIIAGLVKGLLTNVGTLKTIVKGIGGSVVDWLGSIPGVLGNLFGLFGPMPATGGAGGPIVSLVRNMAASVGWTGAQFDALYQLIMHESGFRPTAQNPTSSAYGLFQFLDSTWASVGAHKTSDPAAQIRAGFQYIASRYGSPIGAWNFWQGHHWYHQGGPILEDIAGVGRSGRTYGFQAGERVIARGRQAGSVAGGPVYVQAGAVQISVTGPVTPGQVTQMRVSVEDGLRAVLRELRTGTAA